MRTRRKKRGREYQQFARAPRPKDGPEVISDDDPNRSAVVQVVAGPYFTTGIESVNTRLRRKRTVRSGTYRDPLTLKDAS